jgi:hypothetical protein
MMLDHGHPAGTPRLANRGYLPEYCPHDSGLGITAVNSKVPRAAIMGSPAGGPETV